MSDFQINDHLLTTECQSLARDIVEALDLGPDETLADRLDDAQDAAHEYADAHEWVIYHYKALMLCAHCDVSDGEQFLEDTGMPRGVTFNQLASIIAYGEMQSRIMVALQELAEQGEEAEEAA